MVSWVKKELETRKWSIRELGRRAGVSHAYIADVLRGDKEVTWYFCVVVANAFNEPVWNFFVMAGLLDQVPPEMIVDEKKRLLLKMFDELPPSAQEEALSYLKWLASRQKLS